MPQMSPMPWTMLLILTLISLIMISSIIYFSNQKPTYISSFKSENKFSLKW